MDDNLRTPTFEYDSNDPFVLFSPTSEFELLELLWKKGPVEKPLTGQLPPGSPTLQSGELMPFITEDEMAMWLHYPTEDANDATLRDACDRSMLEQTINAIVPGTEMQIGDDVPCAFEEHVGSSTATRTKRKLNERTGLRVPSEVATFGTGEKRQDHPESVSSRKSHKAKVHNLSERRRRERINEKLKALQELIPRSNKSDKASMLGEAIGYVKSLQNQVQMMSSMGCSMRPMLFPGALPCMPPMAMGMPMNMGMNMNMGMGMPSFGPVLPCTQFNRPPMMPLQNQQDMASLSMFAFQHARPPCPFPFVVPGPVQVQPQSSGSNLNSGSSRNCHDKTEKGKQVQRSIGKIELNGAKDKFCRGS